MDNRFYPMEFEAMMARELKKGRILTPSGVFIDDYHEYLRDMFGDKPLGVFDILKRPQVVKELAATLMVKKIGNRDAVKDLVMSGEIDRMIQGVDPSFAQEVVIQGLGMFHFMRDWHHHRWLRCGSRVYHLSHELVDAFERVEMNYPVSVLNFPYPEFFLQFDHDWLFDKDEGRLPFAGVYVSFPQPMHEIVDNGVIKVNIGDTPVRVGITDSTGAGIILDVLICGWTNDASEGSGFADRLELRTNMTAEESICQAFARSPEGIDGEQKDKRLRVYRVVMNTIMYMSSVDPDIEIREIVNRIKPPRKKRGKGRRRLVVSKFRRTKIVYLGSKLKNQITHKSPVGHMRRGHPRWQPCGPRSSKRKLIFVKPHWVGGKEDDDGTVRVTKVDRDEVEHSNQGG